MTISPDPASGQSGINPFYSAPGQTSPPGGDPGVNYKAADVAKSVGVAGQTHSPKTTTSSLGHRVIEWIKQPSRSVLSLPMWIVRGVAGGVKARKEARAWAALSDFEQKQLLKVRAIMNSELMRKLKEFSNSHPELKTKRLNDVIGQITGRDVEGCFSDADRELGELCTYFGRDITLEEAAKAKPPPMTTGFKQGFVQGFKLAASGGISDSYTDLSKSSKRELGKAIRRQNLKYANYVYGEGYKGNRNYFLKEIPIDIYHENNGDEHSFYLVEQFFKKNMFEKLGDLDQEMKEKPFTEFEKKDWEQLAELGEFDLDKFQDAIQLLLRHVGQPNTSNLDLLLKALAEKKPLALDKPVEWTGHSPKVNIINKSKFEIPEEDAIPADCGEAVSNVVANLAKRGFKTASSELGITSTFYHPKTGVILSVTVDTTNPKKPELIMAFQGLGNHQNLKIDEDEQKKIGFAADKAALGDFFLGVPRAVKQVMELGDLLAEVTVGSHITPVVIGHSHGGGLAQAASLHAGIKGVVFNSRPLGAGTRFHIGHRKVAKNAHHCTVFSGKGDWLSGTRAVNALATGFERLTGIRVPRSVGKGYIIPSSSRKESQHCGFVGQLENLLPN